jgi:Ca-activated chloride channel family protein
VAAGVALADQQLFRSTSDLVEVYATATRRGGALERDLTREDFEIREDGKPRPIVVFSREQKPIAVTLVLDRSGSVDHESSEIRAAGQAFAAQLLEADRGAVGTLTWDCHGFTSDFRALWDTLARAPADYGSPVWPAVDRAMSALAAESGRRVVILVSDGVHEPAPAPARPHPQGVLSAGFHKCSFAPPERRSLSDVIARAERDALIVYSVWADPRTPQGSAGASGMVRLAAATGGSYHRLTSEAKLRTAFATIADELRMQYLLGFEPAHQDGKRHTIDVRVTRPGVSVRARKAYVAGPVHQEGDRGTTAINPRG